MSSERVEKSGRRDKRAAGGMTERGCESEATFLQKCGVLTCLITMFSFAPAAEIRDYFIAVAKKYEIYPNISFQSRVVAARWDEDKAKWFVDVGDTSAGTTSVTTVEADVFVNCGGILNDWKWPDIEGLEDFGGPRVHTANWVSRRDVRVVPERLTGLLG